MWLAVRTAFARGDYMAVVDMATPDMPGMPPTIKLLLAQSYARIGADVLAGNMAYEAITDILKPPDGPDAKPTKEFSVLKGFSVLEMQALRSWLGRLDGVGLNLDQDLLGHLRDIALGPAPETPEESVQLSGQLDEMRQRVAAERTAGQASTTKYRWLNIGAGILAGGLAAASGVAGVAKLSTAVVAPLAFAAAAITAFLTTLKPAEREKESKVRADALGQLAAAIDLFDIDRPDDALGLLPAVKAAHERLAIAEGNAKIVPLVASSKSTARPAITSISQKEGPAAGGQDLTITGTGFTGATKVSFGPAASLYRVESDTEITTTIPAHNAGALKVNVRVTGPGGTSPANAPSAYTYNADPTVTQPSGDQAPNGQS